MKIGIAFFVLVAFKIFVADAIGKEPLNVLIILADDLGWRDLSNEGSEFYESPNIDRIAYEGMKFSQGYSTCQVCSPSRASILTGKYPARLNLTDWIGAAAGNDWKRNTKLLPAAYIRQLPLSETTMAEAFKAAGYRTFFAGKWHLGGQGSLPEDHGFEWNIGGHERGSPPGGYFSPYSNPKLTSSPKGELLPLRLGQETAEWIRAQQQEPFFACLNFYSVHGPIQSTEELWRKYRTKALKRSRPEKRFLVDGRLPVRQTQDHPLYAGMVESMDRAVGIVLNTLDELQLTDRTIVCFTSDNGGVSAGDGFATSNLPLRGGKGRQFEGGIRVPFYIKLPGQPAGICQTPVIATDFYPTLLRLCDLELKPEQHFDGCDISALVSGEGDPGEHLAARKLYWHYPHYGNQGGEPSSIVRDQKWKLISYHETGVVELYNLEKDPGERKNLADAHPDIVTSLSKYLGNWMRDVDAAMPADNPDFDPIQFDRQMQRLHTSVLSSLEKRQAAFLSENYQPKPDWWEKTGD